MRIETNNGGGKNFYSYKQGYWFLKNGTEDDKDWKEVELVDKEKKPYKDFGVYVSAVGGIVTDVDLKKIEHEGRSFEILSVTLDNEDVLSMSFPSEASRKVLQQFEKLDFSKKVILNAWQKDGWSKLNIKQDGEHVENSYLVWDAEAKKMNTTNGYPVRPASSAGERDKANFALDEKDFLRDLATKIKDLVPEFTATAKTEEEESNAPQAEEQTDYPEISPEDIPF